MKCFLITATFLIFSISAFAQDTLYYPLVHHIVTRYNGTGGQDSSTIPIIVDELNKAFAPSRIQFYLYCNSIDTIKSENLYYMSYSKRYELNSINVSNVINIYYFGSILDDQN